MNEMSNQDSHQWQDHGSFGQKCKHLWVKILKHFSEIILLFCISLHIEHLLWYGTLNMYLTLQTVKNDIIRQPQHSRFFIIHQHKQYEEHKKHKEKIRFPTFQCFHFDSKPPLKQIFNSATLHPGIKFGVDNCLQNLTTN